MNNSPSSRNPWPLAITGFFILAIAGLATFVAFATTQKMDLVRPDYYEAELRYQGHLDRLNRTRALGAEAHIRYDTARSCIAITLPSAEFGPGTSGEIHLYRPSDATLDQTIPLALRADATQTVDARKLRSGLWRVQVQWQAGGQEYFLEKSVVLPGPRS